ncbi:MAG TPA: hypothetical protein VNK81_02335 [Thermodesulfobacteriota bacterium]|jgi:hypothetical protein|nr:hypothetical protein [Thermodesulfobacteriota bacterium]
MKNPKPTPEDIREENKRIRMLRLMVDLTMSLIAQGTMTREEALEHFIKVKDFALRLFPGKEDAFDIIYAPRFKRIISDIYGLH